MLYQLSYSRGETERGGRSVSEIQRGATRARIEPFCSSEIQWGARRRGNRRGARARGTLRGASLARNEEGVLQGQINRAWGGRHPHDKPARLAHCSPWPAQTQGLTTRHTTNKTFTSGGCWIRTNVGNAGRFTACSLWPLGQPSEVYEQRRASGGTRTPNPLFTKQVLCQLSYASREHTPAVTPC